MKTNNQNQTQTMPIKDVVYEVNGQEVKLNQAIVKQFVTKGNGNITATEAVNFMMLCKHAELNPFLNEAYLIKFGDKPAQMVVGKEAFMKRANRESQFDGFQAGIVTMLNNEIHHKQGQGLYPNEKLLGGWARVFRKDREYPVYVEVALEEFSKGQSTWKTMPANMIRKVALVNALREAFPESLGALYTEDDSFDDTTSKQGGRRDVTQKEPATDTTKNLLAEFKGEAEETDVVEEVTEIEEVQGDLNEELMDFFKERAELNEN